MLHRLLRRQLGRVSSKPYRNFGTKEALLCERILQSLRAPLSLDQLHACAPTLRVD
jgi:hypothetical protein